MHDLRLRFAAGDARAIADDLQRRAGGLYAHDQDLADELLKHLKPLERQGLIAPWHDRRIPPGGDRNRRIAAELERADMVLFLLSSDFMGSDYCNGVEVRRALQRHAAGEARALPIFLRPVELLARDSRSRVESRTHFAIPLERPCPSTPRLPVPSPPGSLRPR
jgi:hypothetical protein